MKYIRTKNGYIINLSEVASNIKDPKKSKELRIYLKSYGFGEIVKGADTVEELCDLFAFEDAFDEYHLAPDFFSCMVLARLWAKKMDKSIIGYIIVEKNGEKAIEPVAKTNDERKFELL